jgi:hypothetical protein
LKFFRKYEHLEEIKGQTYKSTTLIVTVHTNYKKWKKLHGPEPVFVDLLRRPGIDSQPGGPVRNPICRTGPPGYIGWRYRFLGIESWAP